MSFRLPPGNAAVPGMIAGLWLLWGASATPLAAETNSVAPQATPTATAAEKPVANNSRCFVCHANFEEEQLSTAHAKANVGCARCHGTSSPHCTDENGLTAPDRMFPKGHVRLNCLSCHDWAKLVAADAKYKDRADLPEKPDHQAVLDGTRKEKRFCTDCHGEHRMYYRTKGWDKRTRALVFKDGIPLMVPVEAK